MIIGICGLALVLVLGGVVAWKFLLPRGGAGSPEEAVSQALDAAMSQDPVALLDVLAPAETAGLDEVMKKAVDRAKDEKILSGDGLDAVEFELTDLTFDVDELADGMARVTVTDGRYRVSWDPDALPERLDFLRDESSRESDSGRIRDLVDSEDREALAVMTEKVDGRWYVTMLGTVADQLYRDAAQWSDVDRPDWDALDDPPEPITGKEPEDVINNLVDAAESKDAEEILANFDPELARPLLPYVRMVQSELTSRAFDADLEVSGLELKTEDIGDGKLKVTVNDGSASGTLTEDDGDQAGFEGEVDGGSCISGSTSEYYDYDGGYYTDEGSGCLSDLLYLSDLGVDEFYVVMAEIDGGYQLDPVATVVEYTAAALENLDDALVEDVLRDWEDEVSY